MSDKKVINESTEQAVESSEKFAEEIAKNEEKLTASEPISAEKPEQVIVKKGGSGIGFLALLVAFGVGGAGYYFGMQQLIDVDAKIQALSAKANQIQTSAGTIELPSFDAEKAQLAELATAYKQAQERIAQLEQEQSSYTNQISSLQSQIQRLSNATQQTDLSAWILSDANFLLNNAIRKLVIDNDIDTTKSLLTEADIALSKIISPEVAQVRNAIKADLVNLNSVNQVDQNGLMQRLTTLANRLDDLPLVENEETDQAAMTGDVTDSIGDWQQNIEKTASSFLDHFIRVSDKNHVDEKVFIAPNQEIYLRENIRLRLQIAALAIPRQQNELYKQSIETVSSWIRSYFDTKNENVKAFLKELDSLVEKSIYIDAPEKLQSLTLLDTLLKKDPQKIEKMELKEEKELVAPAASETPKADSKAAEKTPTEQAPMVPASEAQ